MPIQLKTPSLELLPAFVAALEAGWSPDNVRKDVAAREQLASIAKDAAAFVQKLDDAEAKAGDVILPDGSTVRRLPGFHRWIWDGEFCGTIGLRWQPGTNELPPYVLGHIGFAVVPWKRSRGYASEALRLLLPLARAQGLTTVDLTTDLDNTASQHVIRSNGGVLVEKFKKVAAYGGGESLRFRIAL